MLASSRRTTRERYVPLTTELGSLLADHKKHSVSDRWVFTNVDVVYPEGHFSFAGVHSNRKARGAEFRMQWRQ